MKFAIALVLLAGYGCCHGAGRRSRQAPVSQDIIPILAYTNDNNYDGSYKFSYETGNGISVQEEGSLKNAGQGEGSEAQTARGSYSYTAPDGRLIQVTWYADETGFHAEGDHIPKGGPPPPPSPYTGRPITSTPPYPSYFTQTRPSTRPTYAGGAYYPVHPRGK